MTSLGQLLSRQGRHVCAIAADAPIWEALKLMADNNLEALPVVDGDQLVGILSERDYARKAALLKDRVTALRVREVMAEQVACVWPEQSVEACLALMLGGRLRYLAVMSAGQLVGLVSIFDIAQAAFQRQRLGSEN